MKKLIAFVLVLVLVFAVSACGSAPAAPAAQETPAVQEVPTAQETPAAPPVAEPAKEVVRTETTFTAAELEGKVKILGRAYFDEKGLRCDWAASGFEFTVNCEGTLSFETSTNGSSYRYTVFFDGVEEERQISLEGDKMRVAKKDIPAGEHTIRIARNSDNYEGKYSYFRSMTLTCDPGSLAATPDSELFIEYIGDSITAGGGVLGDPQTAWSSACNAATRTYAYVSADLLHADYSMVAKGGIGAVKGNVLSKELYGTAIPFDQTTVYEYTRHPDIIVLALGANDSLKSNSEKFIENMTEYAGILRGMHPDAKLVIAYSFMSNNYPGTYEQLWEKLGGEENGVFLFEGTVGAHGVPAKAEGTPHPNSEDHRVNGEKLAEFIRTKIVK